MTTILTLINFVQIVIGLVFTLYFMRPFWLKFYYRYIDKSDFEITLEGKKYTIKRDTKEYIIDQIKRQNEDRK